MKRLLFRALVIAAVAVGLSLPEAAWAQRGGGRGGRGGHSISRGSHGGHGHHGFRGGGRHHRHRGHYAHGRGHGHRHHGLRHHWRGSVYFGPSWAWDPLYPYAYPFSYGYYAPYPYYSTPAAGEAVVYVQKSQVPATTEFWYFCPSAKAYYPEVEQCDEEWIKVPPRPERPQ
ncbi:MAG TPA: hypothetical protein VEB21_02965 [Terriglobales bacterium]|nr:hypothetical protein [Terriglobales bacterium]